MGSVCKEGIHPNLGHYFPMKVCMLEVGPSFQKKTCEFSNRSFAPTILIVSPFSIQNPDHFAPQHPMQPMFGSASNRGRIGFIDGTFGLGDCSLLPWGSTAKRNPKMKQSEPQAPKHNTSPINPILDVLLQSYEIMCIPYTGLLLREKM